MIRAQSSPWISDLKPRLAPPARAAILSPSTQGCRRCLYFRAFGSRPRCSPQQAAMQTARSQWCKQAELIPLSSGGPSVCSGPGWASSPPWQPRMGPSLGSPVIYIHKRPLFLFKESHGHWFLGVGCGQGWEITISLSHCLTEFCGDVQDSAWKRGSDSVRVH